MTTNEKVSIIIPVYNVEAYLDKCISSIVSQSYENIEIILVDDGSRDNSSEICNKWLERDSRIIVIHKKNGGLSDARNYGIESATGKFMCFVDSDDWLEKDAISESVSAMSDSDADIVIWSLSVDNVDFNEKIISQRTMANDALCHIGEGYDTIIESGAIALYAWNKLYKTELIQNNGIRFEKGISLVEDVLFNSLALPSAKTVRFIPYVGTHYMQRKRTTLGNAFYPDCLELLLRSVDANKKIFKAFGAPENVVAQWEKKVQFSFLLQSIRNICNANGMKYPEKKVKLKNLLNSEIVHKILKNTSKTHGIHNKLYWIAMKLKLKNIIIFTEKSRLKSQH